MASAVNSEKDSAQSPACSTKARPVGGLAEGPGQVPGLAGEHQGRQAGQLGVDLLELGLVGPGRLLGGRAWPATSRGTRVRVG